ncbi:MAG: murein biosynthesis integral membrane protein MurJ [Candidatus Binatia bacterium]
MKSARGRIVQATGLLMALQVVEQVTGLLKQVLIAAAFGISATMDSYVVAISVVGLILLWVRLPVRETLIPLFRYNLARCGEETSWRHASIMLNNFSIALIFIVLAGEILAPYIVNIVALGFNEEGQSLATSLARITMPIVAFIGMGTLLAQMSYSYEKFFRPGIVGTVNNLIVLLALLTAGSMYGIHGLAIAVVIGAGCEFLFQLPLLWHKRKLYSFEVNLRHPEMLQMGKLSFPLLISTGGNELARITDRMFASLLSAGSLSALAFAHRPISVLVDFLINPLLQAVFPHFAKLSAEQDFATLSKELFYYLRGVLFFTLPAAIGTMLTAEAIVKAFYQRGAFDEAAVQLTSQALLCYAIGFPAVAIMRVLRRTFFGLKDTWTPTKIALLRIAIKIVLSWILIRYFAHAGIALAESLSLIANAVLLFCFLPKEIKRQEGARTLVAFAKTLGSCTIMGIIVYLTKGMLGVRVGPTVDLALVVFVGVAVYGLIASFLQAQTVGALLRVVTELGSKYRPRSS